MQLCLGIYYIDDIRLRDLYIEVLKMNLWYNGDPYR